MKEYMQQVSVEDAMRAGRKDSICWDCSKAISAGCSWSKPELGVPVDGWTATKTRIGYIVHDCPEFDRCGYGCGRYRTADDYILALEIANQERKKQIARLKCVPNNLRKLNAQYKRKIEKLEARIEELEKEEEQNGGEEDEQAGHAEMQG